MKLKSLSLLGSDDASCPSKVKLYINRNDIDFENEITALQEIDLPQSRHLLEFPLKYLFLLTLEHPSL